MALVGHGGADEAGYSWPLICRQKVYRPERSLIAMAHAYETYELPGASLQRAPFLVSSRPAALTGVSCEFCTLFRVLLRGVCIFSRNAELCLPNFELFEKRGLHFELEPAILP